MLVCGFNNFIEHDWTNLLDRGLKILWDCLVKFSDCLPKIGIEVIFNTIVCPSLSWIVTFQAYAAQFEPICSQLRHGSDTSVFTPAQSTTSGKTRVTVHFDIFISSNVPLSTLFAIAAMHVVLICHLLSYRAPFCYFFHLEQLTQHFVFLLSPGLFLRHIIIEWR